VVALEIHHRPQSDRKFEESSLNSEDTLLSCVGKTADESLEHIAFIQQLKPAMSSGKGDVFVIQKMSLISLGAALIDQVLVVHAL
jgi:hypothetical protein